MRKIDIKQKKIALSRFIKGYKEANRLILAAKKDKIARMSKEDSLREYDDLCSIGESINNKTKIKQISNLKIQTLIRQRHQLYKVAKIKGVI
jgi:hypothetical protein